MGSRMGIGMRHMVKLHLVNQIPTAFVGLDAHDMRK